MKLHIIKCVKNPAFSFMFIIEKLNLYHFNDISYLKKMFKYKINRKLDLANPKSFNEKMQLLKINDRKKEYINMVDKFEVKKYVARIIGNEFIIPTIGIWDKFGDINFNELPNKFVIKCTHDSGGVFVCDKKNFDYKKIKKKINKLLKKNFYYFGREWPYKNIKPRIIIEEYIENHDSDLIDYKLMCFNGKVKCSFTCTNRKDNLNINFYDENWKPLPFTRHYPKNKNETKKPFNYDLMVNLAEKLSSGIPFLRVDFYEVNNKIYFGELTFYPGSGFEEFKPEEWDYKLGSWLRIEG